MGSERGFVSVRMLVLFGLVVAAVWVVPLLMLQDTKTEPAAAGPTAAGSTAIGEPAGGTTARPARPARPPRATPSPIRSGRRTTCGPRRC